MDKAEIKETILKARDKCIWDDLQIKTIINKAFDMKSPEQVAAEELKEKGFTSEQVSKNDTLQDIHRINVSGALRDLERQERKK